jgi:hypothetical protein
MELQRKSRKILLILDNCAAHHHLDFEKYPAVISVSQHHIPGTANGHGNHKKNEIISRQVGKLHP